MNWCNQKKTWEDGGETGEESWRIGEGFEFQDRSNILNVVIGEPKSP